MADASRTLRYGPPLARGMGELRRVPTNRKQCDERCDKQVFGAEGVDQGICENANARALTDRSA